MGAAVAPNIGMKPTVLTRRVPELLSRRHHFSGRKGYVSHPACGLCLPFDAAGEIEAQGKGTIK